MAKRGVLKLKASAMQFAILVSVIVAIILSSFLLLVHTRSSVKYRSDRLLKNIEAANEGIKYASGLLKSEDSVHIFLKEVPVSISRSYWGGYEIVNSTGGEGANSFQKTGLLGGKPGEDIGIYLENNKLPLILAGDTRIEGDVFVPSGVVEAGSIDRDYFSGNSLVYGRKFPSRGDLPGLDPEWIEYVASMRNFVPSGTDELVALKEINNSFLKGRKVIYQTGKIYLDQTVRGQVIIKSEAQIEVSSFAELDQVLLIAPKVIFRGEFTGSVHVIAEEVIAENNTRFKFPSSITVFRKYSDAPGYGINFKPGISIGRNSVFQGNITFLQPGRKERSGVDLLISENSYIEGSVYCEGYTDLRGTVSGSIFTRYFATSRLGSFYINHLYNAKVIHKKNNFAWPLINGEKKNIAAWLY